MSVTRTILQALPILVAASVSASPSGKLTAASFTLVEDGRAVAVIVTADQPASVASEAASALQAVVRQMSGTEIPIRKEGEISGQAPLILVGDSAMARKAGVEIRQDFEEGDHYVVRVRENMILLVGNDCGSLRGSAYAVYDLLQRLGCGWFGSEAMWQVIPERTTLRIEPMQAEERPAFLDRQMSSLWGVDRSLHDAWRLGGWHVAHSHALHSLVPRAKYEKEHPDWFGSKQPCLTHPEVISLVAAEFRKELDRRTGRVSFSLSADDALGFCDCERCRAVGNASAVNLYFANAVARELAKTHPNRYLLTFYAFWGTHDAPFPSREAEPGVCVMQVNEGNHTQPWDKPERPDISQIIDRNNTRELIAFDGWSRTGAIMAIYEWWIPSCNHEVWKEVPWYSGETAMRNLRWWKGAGVRFVTYQTGDTDWTGLPLHWPLFYVGARGMWNPELTAEQIMREACTKLYGPASEPMRKFYETIERAMADCRIPVKSWRLPSPEKAYLPEHEATAARFLEQAAGMNVSHAIRERINHETRMWARARAVIGGLRSNPQEAKPSTQNPGM